jgi:uracil phosphoribosyltransferase
MGVELLSNVQIVSHSVITPLSSYVGKRIASPAPVFVSILRAGSIMVEGVIGPLP